MSLVTWEDLSSARQNSSTFKTSHLSTIHWYGRHNGNLDNEVALAIDLWRYEENLRRDSHVPRHAQDDFESPNSPTHTSSESSVPGH